MFYEKKRIKNKLYLLIMTIKNLLISGGGLNGMIFLGIIKELVEEKYLNLDEIETIYGASIGSLIGVVLCLNIVNDIIDIIIDGLRLDRKVKIHNFGTFKLNNKKSRIGRNPKTKEEFNISSRNVITFKASKLLLKYINKNNND